MLFEPHVRDTHSYLPMLIHSPYILAATFQRCRRAVSNNADTGEVLVLVSDILRVVEQQGKFLIDVPEGWVPAKWLTAVRADTQRGLDYMTTMKLPDSDVLSPEKRRKVALLRLLVRELHRLWAIGAYPLVRQLGAMFQHIPEWLREPDEPGRDAWMRFFRGIKTDWDGLSLEMREGCCQVVGLDLQAVEEWIKTGGDSIRTAGSK